MVALSRKTVRKKKLVHQTIASRRWRVVTVRPLQTISGYAAIWFWEYVCPAAVTSLRVLGSSPVCRSFRYPTKQWSLDHFDFWLSFFQYDMVTHHSPPMLLFACWTHPNIFIQCWLIFCDVWTFSISTMELPIMWNMLGMDIYWVEFRAAELHLNRGQTAHSQKKNAKGLTDKTKDAICETRVAGGHFRFLCQHQRSLQSSSQIAWPPFWHGVAWCCLELWDRMC